MKYYIELKDGSRYEFNNIRDVKYELAQRASIEIFVVSGQFKPRQRYKDVRISPRTIKDTNYSKLKKMLLGWIK